MRDRYEKLFSKRWHIRTVLLVVFPVFTLLALVGLLLFQLVFTDDVYALIKTNSIRSAAREIGAAVEDDDLAEHINYWTLKEQCTVYITDQDGRLLYSNPLFETESIHLDPVTLQTLYRATKENGGEYSVQTDVVLSPPSHRAVSERTTHPEPPDPIGGEVNKTIVYAYIVPVSGEEARMVAVISALTPVNAVTDTLLVQFAIAAIVIVLLACLLVWIVSRFLARPIVEVNAAAKTLAGEYIPPPEGGYKEILELKRTLEKTAHELKKSEQLQRDLVANLSHDLRTPLTMITGYSEAIRDIPGEATADNLDVIIDEAQRLTRLVNDVLDLSKLQSGTQELSLAPVKISQTVSYVVERVRRMTEKDGYTIEMAADDDVLVMADEVLLPRVVYNLLINALSYTGADRRVTVSCTVTGGMARVSFSDSGDGIPADELGRIWQRYYRVRKDDPLRDSMNSGLGLSIVKALVECHDGRCGVESTIGKGSTFWFELPVLDY